jgi:hypothetical protein
MSFVSLGERSAMSEGSGQSVGEGNDLLFGRSMFAGSFGIMLVGLTQLLGRDQLDLPLTVSIYCFAFSMPLMVTGIYITTFRGYGSQQEIIGFMGIVYFACNFLGLPVALIGLGCLFLHFSYPAAILFAIISVILIALTQGTNPQDG